MSWGPGLKEREKQEEFPDWGWRWPSLRGPDLPSRPPIWTSPWNNNKPRQTLLKPLSLAAIHILLVVTRKIEGKSVMWG